MEKHLLLTISDDQAASHNLRFMRTFFPDLCKLKLTLFYVDPREEEVRGLGNPKGQGQRALESARDWVVAEGCPKTQVETKSILSRGGTVREIVQEAVKGKYDAVLLGRRGLSWFEALVEDSVSYSILWQDIDFPVWICRQPSPLAKPHLLLCADGSDSSLRMADHVGFVLADAPHRRVTMCQVLPPSDANAEREREIYDMTRTMLVENGVAEDRIDEKTVRRNTPVKGILQEANEGNYAVVATGMTGGKPGVISTFKPGSTAVQLLKEVEGFSLWVCK